VVAKRCCGRHFVDEQIGIYIQHHGSFGWRFSHSIELKGYHPVQPVSCRDADAWVKMRVITYTACV
jgi:hypothetical protein